MLSFILFLYALFCSFMEVAALRQPRLQHRADSFEWTALGDSYASGVGAGEYVNGQRCLRYNESYVEQLNKEPTLAPDLPANRIFHNCVCSGAETHDVELYQLYDTPTSGTPTPDYGSRPEFGNPQMATMAIRGDDIDFRGILFNCILETTLTGGLPRKSCDQQRSDTWALLVNPDLTDNVDALIKKVVAKGRKGTIGNDFRLYLTGYPEFFNQDDPACNSVTFARTANPNPDNRPHTLLTTELRQEFNQMSIFLNAAIQNAVSRNLDLNVKFIDIQANGVLDGHRFCEPGVNEPNQTRAETWLFHYPYNQPDSNIFTDAYNNVTQGLDNAALNAKYNTELAFEDAIFAAVDLSQFNDTQPDTFPNPWRDFIGPRPKLFHPKPVFHTHIESTVLAQYISDTSSPAPAPPPQDQTSCHGISGNSWVFSRDLAVKNVNAFCSQTSKSMEFNQNTPNYLSLSIDYPSDETQGVANAPDCVGNFVRAVIDGCDGGDAVNNPNNYKYGGTLTTGSGWVFNMKPLANQQDDDNCDISWKVFFDAFEIRGKNFPPAELGTDGAGLKTQIEGCGALTKWKFYLTPDDVKFQWMASGQLPIGTGGCAGRAVQSAGGATAGSCTDGK